MRSLNQTDAPAEKRSGRGKRAAIALLAGLALLYLCVFAGIYLWSSGFNLKAFLFRDKHDDEQPLASIPRETELTADTAAPKKNNVLPPLDEAADNDDLFSPALPASTITSPPAEPAKPSQARTAPAPEVPGVSFASRPAPVKCWDARGFEHGSSTCDLPAELLRATKRNLNVWESCRVDISGASNTGTLVFFAEADFVKNMMNIWPAYASTLRSADRVAECINEKLRKLPLTTGAHRFSRYRLKGAVRFESPRRAAREKTVDTSLIARSRHLEKAAAETLEKTVSEAKEVPVVKDRVRVRKAPIDGEIIGFISTGQRVKLLEVTDEWCLVKTKRGNVGWMICWGLDLQEKAEKSPPENK